MPADRKIHLKPILWLLVISSLLIGFYGYVTWINSNSPTLYAVNGSINTKGLDMRQGPYIVGGEWLRYQGLPDLEKLPEQPGQLIHDIRYIRYMKGYTYTFSLQAEPAGDIHFMLLRPRNSLLWINGQSVLPEGKDSISSTDCFRLADYSAGGENYDFVLYISAKYPYLGYQGVLLGTLEDLSGIQTKWLLLSTITIGLYLMMILQCIAIYLQKRSEHYLLLLAVFALASLCDFLSIPRHPIVAFFNLGLAIFYMPFSCLPYFICKHFVPKSAPRWMDVTVWCLIGCSVLSLLFFREHSRAVFTYFSLVYMIFQGWLLIVGMLRSIPGIPILFSGWGVNFGLSAFYLLLNNGILPQGIVDIQIMPVQYAQLIYIIAFSIAANGKFARKFSQADELAVTLEAKVWEQTKELRESNQQIITIQQRKQNFITDIAHNLHSPIFSLGGYLDLLRDEITEPTAGQKRNLDLMDQKLRHLEGMVDDMFLIFRLEEGQIQFRFTEFEVRSMLENAAQDGETKAAAKRISIKVDCPTPGLMMVGDQFHFHQAIDNLLDNAIRHSFENGVITLTARSLPEGRLAISVSDRGTGIPEEKLEHLFERYTGKGEGGSTGLGLSITREIVKRHNGEISVVSAKGQGTVFTIVLPCVQ